jgi:drug/metabolite transporter (DMT)-like permease
MTSDDGRPHNRLTRLEGFGLVNLSTLTWATNMVLGRWLRDAVGPLTLAAARYSIASLLFAILLQRCPPEDRRIGRDRWLLLGMALTGVALFTPTLYLGLRHTTAVNATLINGLGPLVTGLLATVLIREPMSRRQVVGAIVALAGVIVLITGGTLSLRHAIRGNVGDIITLAALVQWALYSILARRAMRQRSALSAAAFSAFLGLPLLLIAAAWELHTLPVDPGPQLILALVYLGVAPGLIGLLAWNAGVRRLGPSGAMVFYNTLPLYGALLGHLFLHEPIGPSHLIGGALIVSGGLWAARER